VTPRPRLSRAVQAYVFTVLAVGFLVVVASVYDLAKYSPRSYLEWWPLAALTLASGWLSVKLPGVRIGISISDTFAFAGTLLFGPAVGTVLVLFDATVLCVKEALVRRRLRWEQIVFNIAACPLSIWAAAHMAGINHSFRSVPLDLHFVLILASFTALYFLFNSWLVTIVVALEQGGNPIRIWWNSFTELWINFAAGASIACFLVVNAKGEVNLTFVGVILPLLLVIYFTYHWSTKRVEAEREKVQELNRVFLSTVEALALAIDAKDQVTHGHIRRVQRYTMALARSLGLSDERELDALRAAALLHDTGKLAVPEYILNKPGPLTASEFERMKVHADVGADILKSIDFPYPVEPIVRHHHGQWDGSGYPAGLRGHDIPLGARILSVVDCYDALTSDRPYRPRMARQQAEQVLNDRRGKAYDPLVVDQFLKLLDELEAAEAKEREAGALGTGDHANQLVPAQLEAITATTAEEREFNELRRDLPRAENLAAATELLFGHVRRVVPAASLALSLPTGDTNELLVVAATGVGASTMEGARVAIGDRVSGWVFAHGQAVLNSDATLEVGPVARTFGTPLRYVTAVPIVDGHIVAVLLVYASEPFDRDHRRLLENAATLFVSSGSLTGPATRPSSPASLTSESRSRVH